MYCSLLQGLLSTTTLILLCLVLIDHRYMCPLLFRLNYDVICVIKQHSTLEARKIPFSLIIEWSHLSGNPGPPVRYSDEL